MPSSTDISTLDTITVSASAEREIAATRANLFVTVRGSSLFTGSAALKKAREVAQLVEGLATVEVPESAIELRTVHADVTTGALGTKSSSAVYSLRIRCERLDRMADVIGVITSQRSTKLEGVVWLYPEEGEESLSLLETALQIAQRKANRIATTLNVRLLGVHSVQTEYSDSEQDHRRSYDHVSKGLPFQSRARQVTTEELGLEITHRKTVGQNVTVTYRISGFNGEVESSDSHS